MNLTPSTWELLSSMAQSGQADPSVPAPMGTRGRLPPGLPWMKPKVNVQEILNSPAYQMSQAGPMNQTTLWDGTFAPDAPPMQAGPMQGAADAAPPMLAPQAPGGPVKTVTDQVSGPVGPAIPRPDWSNFDKLSADLRSRGQGAIDAQQQGLTDAQAQIKMALEHQNPQLDLSPLAALTDSWTGSHLAGGYTKPDYAKDNAHIEGLQAGLQKSRGALSDAQIAMLKDSLGVEEKKLGAQERAASEARTMQMHRETIGESRAARADTKAQNLLTHYQDKLNGDKVYTDALGKGVQVGEAEKLIEQASQGSTAALGALRLAMSRVFVPSRLTETEINAMGGEQGVRDRLEQMYAKAAGEGLTPANKKAFTDMLSGVKANIATDLAETTHRHAAQYSKAAGGTVEDATQKLSGGVMPTQQAPAAHAAAPAAAPKAGEVQDGYRFKGGNPADPNAWEKM